MYGKIHIYICRSEGFPLTGIVHPWAQWDMGLDTLENYSRQVVAVVAVAPCREGFAKGNNGKLYISKYILHTWPINQGSRPLSRDPSRRLIIESVLTAPNPLKAHKMHKQLIKNNMWAQINRISKFTKSE